MYEWILPLIGFFIATFAAMSGVGGGVFFVPLLTLAYGFSPSNAVGTSLVVMIFGGIGATIVYGRQKRVYFKPALLLAVSTIPGAILGAYLTSVSPGYFLGLVFGVLLIFLAFQLIFTSEYFASRNKARRQITCEDECFRNKKRFTIAFCLSFLTGVLSGFLGIGGGTLMIPILLLIVSIPIHVAVGTSMFLVAVTALSGVFQHSILGNIDFTFALLLAAGAFIGALVGAALSIKIAPGKVQLIVAVALLITSVQMILKYL